MLALPRRRLPTSLTKEAQVHKLKVKKLLTQTIFHNVIYCVFTFVFIQSLKVHSRLEILVVLRFLMEAASSRSQNQINFNCRYIFLLGSVARSQSLKMAPTFMRNKAESADRKLTVADL